MSDLPKSFVERMAVQLGSELEAFLRSYDEPYCRGIRMNPLKQPDKPIIDVGDRVPWEKNGCYLALDSTAGAHPLHEAGAYYLQEPSAMLPAAVLNAQPGENVLDLCAAPGGKTTQLGLAMQGRGLLVSNEPVGKRAQVLARNVERMGITNCLVVSAMPDKLAQRWPEGFDAIQVDAPCSGEGMFRRHPEARDEWTPEAPEGCAKRQAEILDQAAKMLRKGGRMVYSTCTMNRVENEDAIAAFLERHKDFRLQGFELPGASTPGGMLTCYPHRMRGEGHFVALLVRDGEGKAVLPTDTSLPKADKAMTAAVKAFVSGAPAPTAMLGECAVFLPNCPDVRGLKVLRAGLHLGVMKGKVFAPDHAWAMAFDRPNAPVIALGEDEARRYQAGETIEVSAKVKGYVLPTLDGLALGWGKVSDGVMKNHYPKGLRRSNTQG